MAKKQDEGVGKYLFKYTANIVDKVLVTYQTLEPGMVVEMYYQKDIPGESPIKRRYMIMILSTKVVPGTTERYVYALSLAEVMPSNFTKFVARLGLDESSVKLFRAKKVKFPRVYIPVDANPKNIYNMYIKPKLETTLGYSYRTFKKENIVQMHAVNFNWNDVLVRKYLVEGQDNPQGKTPSDTENK